MKSTALAAGFAVLATVFSVSASAQTGRPAEAPSDRPSSVVDDSEPGSYARYLMLNGKPRDIAIREAQNQDHPASTTHFASHAVAQQRATPAPAAPVHDQP